MALPDLLIIIVYVLNRKQEFDYFLFGQQSTKHDNNLKIFIESDNILWRTFLVNELLLFLVYLWKSHQVPGVDNNVMYSVKVLDFKNI